MTIPLWLEVPARSAVVYVALLGGLRLAGKRHAGQLSPHDFVLILLVSNAVQNAMVGTDSSLPGGLLSAITLIVINVLITRLLLRHRKWGPVLAGQPALLIHNGVVLEDALEHEGIMLDELDAQIRMHGFETPREVKTAVQECDGSISVIGFGDRKEVRLPPLQHPRRKHRRGRKP